MFISVANPEFAIERNVLIAVERNVLVFVGCTFLRFDV